MSEIMWHRDVPLKVYLFAWRLFINRLPKKDNLFRRGIIPSNSQLSICGSHESANHLLLTCNIFSSPRYLVRSWFGISSVDPYEIADHFVQFSSLAGFSKSRRFIRT